MSPAVGAARGLSILLSDYPKINVTVRSATTQIFGTQMDTPLKETLWPRKRPRGLASGLGESTVPAQLIYIIGPDSLVPDIAASS